MRRDRVPLQWAAIQNNLGIALSTLSERRPSPQHLWEAFEAFEGAREVFVKEAGYVHYNAYFVERLEAIRTAALSELEP